MRFYHPRLGRFIAKDPVSYLSGPNLYQYVKGRPLTLMDPSGLGLPRPKKCTVNECCGDLLAKLALFSKNYTDRYNRWMQKLANMRDPSSSWFPGVAWIGNHYLEMCYDYYAALNWRVLALDKCKNDKRGQFLTLNFPPYLT